MDTHIGLERDLSVEELVECGQTAERDGRRQVARDYFERALHRVAGGSNVTLSVTLTRWIARTYVMDRDLGAAIDCTELSLALAEAQQDTLGIAHALNTLGSAHQQRGDLPEAARLLERAREYADATGDGRLLAMIEQNLGIVAKIRGDLAAAVIHYQASLTAFRSELMEEHASYALNSLGILFTDLQRWEEAEQAFQDALESSVRSRNAPAQIMIGVNRTGLALAQRQYGPARDSCDRAFKLARQLNDVRALSELHKHYGVIFRETDELSSSEAHLSRAGKLAAERGDLLLAAETAREEAELFSRQGRNQETLRSLNHAHGLFARLHAEREIAEVDGRMVALETKFLELVKRWGESIESADQYTHGHCMRVANFASALARGVGFEERTLFWFRLGALLHDVGKIIVPGEVLNKPGQLSAEERTVIEHHTDAGVALLAEIEFPWDIRPMVRHHHERWEGGGYPLGIAGEDIPLSARVLCIADVYDALTSERPYRAGFSQERALDIMTTSMASHFDPKLLMLWRELCDSGVVAALARSNPDDGLGQVTADLEEEEALSLKILVVARNFSDASLLRVAAAADGGASVEVAHVARLSDALHRLREESFDAVVLGFPLQEGLEIQALTHVHESAPEIPLLVLANGADEWLARQSIRNGAQDFLVRAELSGSMLLRSIRYAIERNRLKLDLQAKSLLDDLTGLYNRRGFFTIAQQQLKLADRKNERTAIIFADVNDFKQINDRFGHREGDLALVDISNLLKSTFRQSDILVRLGGDEFVALVQGAGAGAVATLMDRLTKHLDIYNDYAGRRYQLSISIGSTIYEPHTRTSIDELLRRADKSMYDQKQGSWDVSGRAKIAPKMARI